jgi:DHA1 family bicyclomycin/chloramphenicol resistance-like MFS transporter
VGIRSSVAAALGRRDRKQDLTQHGQQPQSHPVRLYLVLSALTILGPFAIDMYLPGLPALARDLHAGESASQLTLTACLAGLALGQLITGPFSDILGRRRPVLVGLAAYVASSLLCALANSIELLVAFRLLQGVAGGACVVIATAVVRDRYTGAEAAKFFSLLVLAIMISPLFAPTIGGELLHVTTWHGIFIALAAVGLAVAVAAAIGLPETLPAERRRRGSILTAPASLWRLITDRQFLSFALPACLLNGSLFAYIAGSAFVFQQVYGTSPQVYGLLFALNGLGMIVSSQLNRLLLNRFSPYRLMRFGLAVATGAGVVLLAVGLSGSHVLLVLLVPLTVLIGSFGFVAPNANALALSEHGDEAGAGSALLGSLRFVTGAVVAPLVGIAGSGTALPMVIMMVAFAFIATAGFLGLGRRQGPSRDGRDAAEQAA